MKRGRGPCMSFCKHASNSFVLRFKSGNTKYWEFFMRLEHDTQKESGDIRWLDNFCTIMFKQMMWDKLLQSVNTLETLVVTTAYSIRWRNLWTNAFRHGHRAGFQVGSQWQSSEDIRRSYWSLLWIPIRFSRMFRFGMGNLQWRVTQCQQET